MLSVGRKFKLQNMSGKKVIKRSNIPTYLPFWKMLLSALALDYWHAPGWLWGAAGTLFLVDIIVTLIKWSGEEEIDLLKDHK